MPTCFILFSPPKNWWTFFIIIILKASHVHSFSDHYKSSIYELQLSTVCKVVLTVAIPSPPFGWAAPVYGISSSGRGNNNNLASGARSETTTSIQECCRAMSTPEGNTAANRLGPSFKTMSFCAWRSFHLGSILYDPKYAVKMTASRVTTPTASYRSIINCTALSLKTLR